MKNKITINGLYREELDPKLYDLIYELKNKFGIKGNLDISIVDDPPYQSNLYGGRFPSINSKFCLIYYNKLIITRGVLKKININEYPNELKSLIAHEFSHIFNNDSLFFGIFSIIWLVSSFVVLTFVTMILKNVGLSVIIFIIYAVIVGRAVNRWRRGTETRCDKDAVNIIKNPVISQQALNKIHVEFDDIKDTILIRDKPRIYLKRFFYWIFGNTHPAHNERIKNIKSLNQIKND